MKTLIKIKQFSKAIAAFIRNTNNQKKSQRNWDMYGLNIEIESHCYYGDLYFNILSLIVIVHRIFIFLELDSKTVDAFW